MLFILKGIIISYYYNYKATPTPTIKQLIRGENFFIKVEYIIDHPEERRGLGVLRYCIFPTPLPSSPLYSWISTEQHFYSYSLYLTKYWICFKVMGLLRQTPRTIQLAWKVARLIFDFTISPKPLTKIIVFSSAFLRCMSVWTFSKTMDINYISSKGHLLNLSHPHP